MSVPNEFEAYFNALDAIETAGEEALEVQRRVGEEDAARVEAAGAELQDIRDRRERFAARIRDVDARLDAADVGPGPLERAVDPPAITSLDDAMRLINQYDDELDQTITSLEEARATRLARRWAVAAVLVCALGPLGVFLAGGSLLFTGGCAVAMVTLFALYGVGSLWAFVLPGGCAVLCIVIAYFSWTWWQVLIGVVVLTFVAGAIKQGVEKVQSAVRTDRS